MKAPLYVTARAGGRPGKDALENAWEHFVSTGGMVGSDALIAEIANRALEKKWTVTIDVSGPNALIKRATRLSQI